MLLVLLFLTIIGVIIGIIHRNVLISYPWNQREPAIQICGWGIYGMILSVIFGFIFGWISDPEYKSITQHHLYIYSLKNINNTEGGFFLGSGAIEQVEYYYFFYKGKNGYVRGKLEVNRVSIQETTSRRPEIVEIERVYKNDGFWDIHYIMYVPKHTIIKEFMELIIYIVGTRTFEKEIELYKLSYGKE
jgi:hypothetical protein